MTNSGLGWLVTGSSIFISGFCLSNDIKGATVGLLSNFDSDVAPPPSVSVAPNADVFISR